MRIVHRYSRGVLYEDAAATVRESVVAAVDDGSSLGGADLRGADLRGACLRVADLRGARLGGADLRGADLRGADLHVADLRGADLRGADLHVADLRGVDLRGARLRGVDLRGAYLRGAKIEWSSHDLVAEILRRAAGDDVEKLAYAGLILIRREWCWSDHLKLKSAHLEWALRELAKWIQPDDGHPGCLDAYRASEPTATADSQVVA